MSRLDLEKLKQYKDDILKAEIGALLFNLGKTHIGIGFWKKYFPKASSLFQGYSHYFSRECKDKEDDSSSKEKCFFKELTEISEDFKKFFEKLKIEFPFLAKSISIIELLKGQESAEEFIKKIFFMGCENINSAIDKNFPNKSMVCNLWISNAFGRVKEEVKEENFDNRRKQFLKRLYVFLNEKRYLNNNPDWKNIRNFILKEIKEWYSHLLSDSRFPVNDVTLFDQAYMVASLFKAVVAHLIIDYLITNTNKSVENYLKNPFSIKWRILGIQYDKLGLTEKSLKLPSIRWYRETIREIDEKIKELLEVEYPIGNEIYRDDTGIYFIVGEGLGEDLNDGSNLAKLKDDLKDIENEIMKIFKDELEEEVYPTIILTEASRGLMNLSTLLEKAKENFLKIKKAGNLTLDYEEIEYNREIYKVKKDKNFITIKRKNTDGNETEERIPNSAIGICPLCQSRLIYIEDKERRDKLTICGTCYKRIHHKQVEKWIKEINNETIWTSEIKDKNNRIAYISVKFELMDWLRGDLVNTFLVNLGKGSWYEQKGILVKYLKRNIDELKNKMPTLQNLYDACSEIKRLVESSDTIRNIIKDIYEKMKSNDSTLSKTVRKDIEQVYILTNRNIDCEDIFHLVMSASFIRVLHEMLRENSKLKEFFEGKPEMIVNLEKDISNYSYIKNLLYNENGNLRSKNSVDGILKKQFDISNIYPFSINSELEQYYYKYSSFRRFAETILFNNTGDIRWQDLLLRQLQNKDAIDFENRKINWDKLNNQDIDIEFLAELVLQFLLRKNPSPARLRRIWESTREFLEKIHKNLDERLQIPEWRKKRLVWKVEDANLQGEKSQELEGNGLLFWMEKITDKDLSNLSDEEKEKELRQSKKAKIYLISSIEDFLEKFGDEGVKKALRDKQDDYLNSILTKKEKLKGKLVDASIRLVPYLEDKTYSEKDKDIEIDLNIKDSLSEIHSYKPYSLITDISPINYQVIIPAKYVPKFIDTVLEEYDKEFKYVYGKLPIHIGIVISNYKKPVYINLKALRKIRRDVKDTEKLWIERDVKEFCQLQKEKLKEVIGEEIINDALKYYALYFDNSSYKMDYNFYIKIKPNNDWKVWLSTTDKFPLNSKVKMIPNTFDFEFMDSNIRREDIYYDENDYKRAIKIKSNRPYELEVYWKKFKNFKDLFNDKANKAKMHKLINIFYDKISIFYDKLQNYREEYNSLLASAIVNILELKKHPEFIKHIKEIFDLECEYDVKSVHKALNESLNETKIRLFIDMFEFWHTALKEV